jgi:tetratricopeptide (TPR) repeat protein
MVVRALLFLTVCAVFAVAQFDAAPSNANVHVRIHVAYAGGNCESSTKVELMQSMNSVARGVVDRNCMVDLVDVPPGTYRIVISGPGFVGIESSEISITRFDTDPIEVRVSRPDAQGSSGLSSSSTSVTDLKLPRRAANEFEKASRQMDQQDWKAAEVSLQRAIAIYPQYAAAYNNLAVVYARVGDRGREVEVLRQAIAIDSHYAQAYVNLARMEIAANNFASAEADLKQAIGADPKDGVSMVLITYAEYMNHHFEDAVRDCRKLHALNSIPHAFAHYTAAFALEQEHRIAEAGAEFQTFIQEEPAGKRADDARRELAHIADYLGNKNNSNSANGEQR